MSTPRKPLPVKPEPKNGVCCVCGYAGEHETPCLSREDRTHCVHWWDGPGGGGEVLPAAKPEPWIVSKPGVMGGKPCVRGTRITVETIQRVAHEWSSVKILEEYPGLTAEGLAAALEHRLPKRKGKRT